MNRESMKFSLAAFTLCIHAPNVKSLTPNLTITNKCPKPYLHTNMELILT